MFIPTHWLGQVNRLEDKVGKACKCHLQKLKMTREYL